MIPYDKYRRSEIAIAFISAILSNPSFDVSMGGRKGHAIDLGFDYADEFIEKEKVRASTTDALQAGTSPVT